MSDHILKTIEQIVEEVSKAEDTIRPKKLLANQLCDMAGIPMVFPNIEDPAAVKSTIIRRNAFFGKPLSSCIREFLEMRVSLPVKEATLDEIFSALKEGGYDLKASGDKEDDQKRGVAITMGKNSQTFHRLPTGDYGLLSWYPNIRDKKQQKAENGTVAPAPATAAAPKPEEPTPAPATE
jgi:hypothetical protein